MLPLLTLLKKIYNKKVKNQLKHGDKKAGDFTVTQINHSYKTVV